MINSANLRLLVLITDFAFYTGTLHYHFVRKPGGNYQIHQDTSKGRYIFVRGVATFVVLYEIFLFSRIIQNVVTKDTHKEDSYLDLEYLISMAYQFCAYLLAFVIQTNTLLKWEEVPLFIWQYIRFFKKFEGEYLLPSAMKGNKCMKFFTGMVFIGCAVLFQNLLILLKKPDLPHFLTSLFRKPKEARLIFYFANVWMWLILWSNLWTYAFFPYLYISCSVFAFRQMDPLLKTPRTTSNLRSPGTCIKLFRSLHILHRLWQVSYEEWFLPYCKATTVWISTLALYGVIRLTGPKSYVMGFTAFLTFMYLGVFYLKLGQIEKVSNLTFQNWRTLPGTSKYMRKFMISMPVVFINVGSFYRVKKITVFTIIWTVLNNTITLFLL